jgi:hypothetical protein
VRVVSVPEQLLLPHDAASITVLIATACRTALFQDFLAHGAKVFCFTMGL